MQASLEILSGVIRFWVDGDYGKPYDWCATVRWVSPTTVEILGLVKAPTPQVWRAVKDELAKYGVEQIVFYRFKNGQKIERSITVSIPRVSSETKMAELSVTTPGNLRKVALSYQLTADWDDNPNNEVNHTDNREVVWTDVHPMFLAFLQKSLAEINAKAVQLGVDTQTVGPEVAFKNLMS